MTAIYKRELGSYYKGFIGYLFAVPLLVVGGIYTWVYNFMQGSAQFESAVSGLGFVLIFIVPVLTMRVMAEERHQKTDQLLYSLPTTMTRVVLGKYLAMVTVLAVPVAVMALYPLIMSAFGTVSFTMAYGNLLAFFLLGCALIAMGEFISSTTDNQTVALVLCLLFMLLNYFLTGIASLVSDTAGASLTALVVTALLIGVIAWLLTRNVFASGVFAMLLVIALAVTYLVKSTLFAGLFTKIMQALSLFSRLSNFQSGLFDLGAVIYYLAFIAVFLFLTVQSMEKRRWN